MTDITPNRIVNRRPGQQQGIEATQLQLVVVPSPPPGPWLVRDRTGELINYEFNGEDYRDGLLVVVSTNRGPGAIYNEFYIFMGNGIENGSWKRVDLNWPKIDPRTGRPFDQYLDWYSPLAE